MTFLSRIDDGTQTFTTVNTAADPAAGAPPLAEGTTIAAADGYCTLMLNGNIPAAVPDVRAHPPLAGMAVTTEIGVGS